MDVFPRALPPRCCNTRRGPPFAYITFLVMRVPCSPCMSLRVPYSFQSKTEPLFTFLSLKYPKACIMSGFASHPKGIYPPPVVQQ